MASRNDDAQIPKGSFRTMSSRRRVEIRCLNVIEQKTLTYI